MTYINSAGYLLHFELKIYRKTLLTILFQMKLLSLLKYLLQLYVCLSKLKYNK